VCENKYKILKENLKVIEFWVTRTYVRYVVKYEEIKQVLLQ